ncbi:MAG TPA: response regulator transcription factor [Burkholderiaceae bacterium]|nr:response regulator transcription factor [Burkholderiaceae bacterium]
MRLLLIEDDPLLGSGLRDFLQAEGHAVVWAQRLAEANAPSVETFDAYLVDWSLPDGSGLEWLLRRRARGDRTATLMLTARDLLADRVSGLDAGADDYLVKPFAPEELSARLRAVMRRQSGVSEAGLRCGDVLIDLAGRSVRVSQQPVELTAREWAVLEALALRPGRIVSKDELEQLALGGAGEVSSNALEVHVSSLRRKLGRDLLQTVRGLGYRLSLEAQA